METVINHLIVLGGALGIVAVAYIAWLASGVGNIVTKDSIKNWSWKRCGKDIVKYLCFCISLAASSITVDALGYYVNMLEVEVFSNIMTGLSWTSIVVLPIGLAIYLIFRAFRNNKSIINYDDAMKALGVDPDKIVAVDNSQQIAEAIYSFFPVPEGLAEEVAEYEEVVEEALRQGDTPEQIADEIGLGAYYSVPIGSYDEFRNTVNGKGYDIDGAYGAQCFDGAGLLYQQLGRSLSTGGTGAARGCWTHARDYNSGNGIAQIPNKMDVRRGDIVVFGSGTYGHIGFADEDYNGGAYIKLLGQNQGGVAYPGGGSNFNVVNVSMSSFLGAFRYEKWHKNTPAPAPAPAPTPAPSTGSFKVGDVVVPTRLVDYNGTSLVQYDPTYTITQISGDRAVLSARGAVWAAMRTSDIRKA